MDRRTFGQKVGASETLLCILEAGGITHPNIAARIIHEIGGTVNEYNQIVHKTHRAKKLPKAEPIMVKETSWSMVCPTCKKGFIAYRKGQIYCSISCSSKNMQKERKKKKEKEGKQR